MINTNDYYVYEWIRLDTMNPFYIGKGRKNRCYDLTRGNNKHFNNIVKKIDCVVNILRNDLTEYESLQYECWYIHEYKYEIGYDLVNLTDGGEGIAGYRHTNDAKIKISNFQKQHIKQPMSQETKNKLSEFQSGKTYEEKYGKEKSEKLKEQKRKKYIEKYGEKKANELKEKLSKSYIEKYGEQRTKEIKQKLSKSHKNSKFSDSQRELCRIAKMGNKNPMYICVSDKNKILIEERYINNNYLISKTIVQEFGISRYKIEQILRERGVYKCINKS